jgi:Asp-tRNA(Asn)/Glu-tRNA(Gln) amidotransferase A subunit family amidase
MVLIVGEINGEKGYAHAPVCLQLVGARWEDENVVEAMARIEKAMGRSYK